MSESSIVDSCLLPLADLDKPIYRIFPRERFLQALSENCLALVCPSMWDDPFEIVDSAISVHWTENGQMRRQIIQGLPSVFAQSWSATRESDALLRTYSKVRRGTHSNLNTCPDEEGVRVQTTPRKLLQAVLNATTSTGEISCFIGAVTYVSADKVLSYFSEAIYKDGLDALSLPKNRATGLLRKRVAFSSEAEVRVMAIHHQRTRVSDRLLRVPIQPNDFIDEVAFDPRLADAEMYRRQEEAKARGYTGRFHNWELYTRVIPVVQMPSDWVPR